MRPERFHLGNFSGENFAHNLSNLLCAFFSKSISYGVSIR